MSLSAGPRAIWAFIDLPLRTLAAPGRVRGTQLSNLTDTPGDVKFAAPLHQSRGLASYLNFSLPQH